MDLSILIPVYDEEESINELYQTVCENIPENTSCEIVFANDGSKDGTLAKITDLQKSDPRVVALNSKRNRGKSSALAAAFDFASGDLAITLDGDLQDDPREFKNLIAKINEGYDLVSGWKIKRQDNGLRKFASKVFNTLVAVITECNLHDINCGLKIYKKEVYKNLLIYGDLHRLLPALAQHDGFKIGEIPVNHFPRKFGHSKYSLFRVRGILDLVSVRFISSFSLRPFHFFGMTGGASLFLGILIWLYSAFNSFSLASLMHSLFFIGIGLFSFSLGFASELIINHYLYFQKKKDNAFKPQTAEGSELN